MPATCKKQCSAISERKAIRFFLTAVTAALVLAAQTKGGGQTVAFFSAWRKNHRIP